MSSPLLEGEVLSQVGIEAQLQEILGAYLERRNGCAVQAFCVSLFQNFHNFWDCCQVPDSVQQLHVQQPSTYAKPEAASAVLGS